MGGRSGGLLLSAHSTIHLKRNKITDLDWVSYVGEGAFNTNFSINGSRISCVPVDILNYI